MSECDYSALDVGIRDVVRTLRLAGFDTTDSGDGVSKPPDQRVFECRHVAAVTCAPDMVCEAHRMAEVLGDGWAVEATYWPTTRTAIVLATETAMPAPPTGGSHD